MTRQFATFGMAALCACALGLRADAQQTEPKTKIEAEHAKTVTYTGCVQTGTTAESYVLAHAIPLTQTETKGTSGTVSTVTTYALVPEKTVTLHEQVGQKVEVTGVLIKPGHGEAKIETRTKEQGATSKTKAEIERGPLPQFRVVSMKPLGERCE
jgi:hypothetical protein